jgi:hypothetical protein
MGIAMLIDLCSVNEKRFSCYANSKVATFSFHSEFAFSTGSFHDPGAISRTGEGRTFLRPGSITETREE